MEIKSLGTKEKVEIIQGFINEATSDQLSLLYNAIQERREVLNRKNMRTAQVGDKVKFDSRKPRFGMIFGTITDIKRSKVHVLDTHGRPWSVQPGILTPSDH